MPAQHDQAICIRHWDYSETSQTVGLFGRTLGCFRGLAKGARRERGSFSGGLDLLTRVGAWFDEYLNDDTPLPRLYPTPEGGVEAEWLIDRLDVSIEFDEAAGSIEWHAMDLDTGVADEQTIEFDDSEALDDLGRKMARVTAQQSTRPVDENGGSAP